MKKLLLSIFCSTIITPSFAFEKNASIDFTHLPQEIQNLSKTSAGIFIEQDSTKHSGELCSGLAIDEHSILLAAHCFLDTETGKLKGYKTVYVKVNPQNIEKFILNEADIVLSKNYFNGGDPTQDHIVMSSTKLKLKNHLQNEDIIKSIALYTTNDKTVKDGYNIYTFGFSNQTFQWVTSKTNGGNIMLKDDIFMIKDIVTSPGDSGGATFLCNNQICKFLGINTMSPYNSFTLGITGIYKD